MVKVDDYELYMFKDEGKHPRSIIILHKDIYIEVAKRDAEEEYGDIMRVLPPECVKLVVRRTLKEMYAREGLVGYLIRIELKGE